MNLVLNWMITRLNVLVKRWGVEVDGNALDNLVELAYGGITVTTESYGVRYRTVLQIDGDVIQKFEIAPEVEGEDSHKLWQDHLASVDAQLEGVREVVDRWVGMLVYIVSAVTGLLGIGAVFGMVSDWGAEITVGGCHGFNGWRSAGFGVPEVGEARHCRCVPKSAVWSVRSSRCKDRGQVVSCPVDMIAKLWWMDKRIPTVKKWQIVQER